MVNLPLDIRKSWIITKLEKISYCALFLSQVRELKKAAALGGDAASYHEAMKQIEDEMNKIKNLYEAELNKLR